MFKIIRKSRYRTIIKNYEAICYDNKRLRKEIEELNKPFDIITVEAKENIDKLCLIPAFEEARVKRNISIELRKQILEDESIIKYYTVSTHPNMLFAEIRIIKPKTYSHES